MATSADIAVQSSNYVGNAQLGGAGGEAFKLDSRPLEQLTAYTNLYNKAQYEQKQKNADAAVAQLADLSSINANLLWEKDKNYLTTELSGAIKQTNELLGNVPTNPDDLMKWQMKFQGIVKKVKDDYATGKQRSVAREAQIAHIRQTYKDPKVQDSMIAQLNKKLNDTDITTLLSAMPDFEPTVVNIPKAVPQTFNTISTNGEDNVEVKGSFFSPRQSGMAVTQSLFNLKSVQTDPNSPKYQQMTETERMAADVQNGVKSPIQTMEENANNFNSILLAKNPDGTQKYFDNGKFNEEKFETDNAGNTLVMSVYSSVKDLDQYSRKKLGELTNGIYDDKGFKFNLPQTITKDEFAPGVINWENGVNPTQLGIAQMKAGAAPDAVVKDVKHTGERSQDARTAAQLKNARDINANTQSQENYRAMLPYRMAKKMAGATGKQVQEAAESAGNLLYGVNTPKNINVHTLNGKTIANVSIKNGAVVDSKGEIVTAYSGDLKLPAGYFNNSMITEYYKVAGKDAPAVLVRNGKYTARFKNGVIVGLQTVADNSESGVGGSFIDENQFRHITEQASQINVSAKDYPDVNYGVKPTVADDEYQKILEEIKNMKP